MKVFVTKNGLPISQECMDVKKLASAAMANHVINALIKMHESVEDCLVGGETDFVKMIT